MEEAVTDDGVLRYKGLYKVTVRPMRRLYIPVLPMRINGKLTFPLCAACARDSLSHCTHTTAEMAWTGVYTHVELQAALDRDYIIVKVIEVSLFSRHT